MTTETLDFTVDPAILHSIIQAQAGTLPKALLEGVMNSIDAGATSLSVKLTTDSFTVSDDGRGFQSRDEIEKWFRRFGTPHTEGDAIYGKFRMGRGQLMAFAKNTWRTGTFEMNVDIKNKGMNFDLNEKLRDKTGCTVTGILYDTLSESDLQDTIAEFTSLVKFAQIPVRLNGKVISKRPQDLAWDMETPEAYIKLDREKSLSVYNLGVLVRTYENWKFGCGGVVVTKQPVQVNFARNDILTSQCVIWKRISTYMKEVNIQKVARKGSLNKDERRFLAKQYTGGEIKNVDVNPLDLKLITDITGRHHSISDLISAPRISFSTEQQGRTGTKLHRQGSAFVIGQETLERFSACDINHFLSILREATNGDLPELVPFEQLASDFSEEYATTRLDSLPREEQVVFQVVNDIHAKFFAWYRLSEKSTGIRELQLGESNVAKAWTDGRTYIVLGRDLIKQAAKRGAPGFMALLTVLLHEYIHDDADLESHTHDLHFYTKFHDLMVYGGAAKLLTFATSMTRAYERLLAKENIRPSKSVRTRPITKAKQKEIDFMSRQLSLI